MVTTKQDNDKKQHTESTKNIEVEFVDQKESSSKSKQASSAQAKKKSKKSDKELIQQYEKRIQELEDQLLRLRAEFINYKRRVEREQLEFADYIKGELFKKLLPVLDDFKMMMEKSEQGNNEKGILEGARIIYRKFMDILEKEGLERIDALGKDFDPAVHEALMTQPSSQEHHEKVIGVFQDGYKLKERLLRPSKVIVGKFEQEAKEASEKN